MSDQLVLVGDGQMFMTAATRDALLARPDLKMAPEVYGLHAGWKLDGIRVVILTEEELREKAKTAKPAPPRAPMQVPIARSVPVQHPKALSREATRRRRQMAARLARADA